MLGQRALWLGADALRGRVRGAQLRMLGLELLQLAKEAVVFDVGERRAVEHVVLVARLLDLLAERRRARGEVGRWGGHVAQNTRLRRPSRVTVSYGVRRERAKPPNSNESRMTAG